MKLAVLLFAANLAHAATMYHVAGVVVNSETGAPLSRAIVAMQTGINGPVIARQVTGPDARFSFELPQGAYRLWAGTGDVMEFYGQRSPDVLVGTSVMTSPGQDTSNLVFRWYPVSAISGRVVDESGEPVENALIQLLAERTYAGRRTINTFGWSHTDDRGEYRFGRIVGGTYYLAVTAEPWYTRGARLRTSDPVSSAAYAPVCYPNTSEPSRAAPIVVKPGEEAKADFSLRTVTGAMVTVTYEWRESMSGLVSLIREGIGGSDGYERQERAAGGMQILRGVPPGRYLVRLTATEGQDHFSAHQWIDVNGADVEVKLELHAAPLVSGRLEWKNAATRPKGTILLTLSPEDPGVRGVSAAVHADGAFAFPPVLAGRYRLSLSSSGPSFAVDFRADGADVHDGVLTLTEDESVTLHVPFSGDVGTVRGFVLRDDKPVEGMMVVLAPVTESTNRLAYHGFQTDSDGSFDFENRPAGEYYLFAVDDVNLEYTNPAAIRAYCAHARRVRVEGARTITERIGILTPAR